MVNKYYHIARSGHHLGAIVEISQQLSVVNALRICEGSSTPLPKDA
jgi:hypothetical protein